VRIQPFALAIASGLWLTAGSAAEPTVSFSRDIAPQLEARCSSCHLTAEEPGKLALYTGRAYESLVDVPSVAGPLKRVAPGDPEESFLVRKLDGTQADVGGGARMPMGSAPLPAELVTSIRAWIAAGAPRN
jgi:hypothetical protein